MIYVIPTRSFEKCFMTQIPSRNISSDVSGLGYSQSTLVQNGSARVPFSMWRWTRKREESCSPSTQIMTSPSSNHRSLDFGTFSSGCVCDDSCCPPFAFRRADSSESDGSCHFVVQDFTPRGPAPTSEGLFTFVSEGMMVVQVGGSGGWWYLVRKVTRHSNSHGFMV